jgi:hypothetical protein
MDCRAPDAIHEDDLVISALDPDALTAEARQHLAECPACAERAAEYQTFTRALSSRLYRWDCPTTLEISDYASGLLTGKRKRAISAHLKRCPHCAEEVEISREFLAPTPHETARAGVGTRLFPSRIFEAAQVSLRGSADETAWPLEYHIDDITLSLDRTTLSVGGTDSMLLGILLSADVARVKALEGVEVRLLVSGAPDQAPLAVERIDDAASFAFSSVPIGRYDLLIALPEGDLVIQGIELSD